MKCPYCTDALPDGAIVCPTCHRDLAFFRPISDRLSKVEEALKEVKSRAAYPSEHPRHVLVPLDAAPTIAVFVSALLSFTFTWIDWRPGITHDLFWQSLAVGAPFFAALLLGMLGSSARPSFYLLLGVVSGFLGYVEMLVLYGIGRVHEALALAAKNGSVYVISLPRWWSWSLLVYPTAGALFFLVGGICGEQLRSLGTPRLNDDQTEPNEEQEQLRKWLEILSPYAAAFLTLITAIVTHFIDPKGK